MTDATDMAGGSVKSAHGSQKKTSAELRKFGLVMATPLTLLAALFYWRQGLVPMTYGLGGGAAFFLVVGLTVPRALAPIEFVWMRFAAVLGYVMTRVILTLTFVLAITPLGLVIRILGRDPLGMKFDKNATTYWVPTEADGPGTRPRAPF
jgi:hypothetical protein